MPRKTNDYAKAAAALRDLSKLSSNAPARKRCPPGFTTDPYGKLVPVKGRSVTGLLNVDRQRRTPAPITLPEVTALVLSDEEIRLTDADWDRIRAERALIAHRKPQ